MVDDNTARIAVLEVRQANVEDDIREIKGDIRELKSSIQQQTAGLTRPERIALVASGSAVIGALIGVIALLNGSGAP